MHWLSCQLTVTGRDTAPLVQTVPPLQVPPPAPPKYPLHTHTPLAAPDTPPAPLNTPPAPPGYPLSTHTSPAPPHTLLAPPGTLLSTHTPLQYPQMPPPAPPFSIHTPLQHPQILQQVPLSVRRHPHQHPQLSHLPQPHPLFGNLKYVLPRRGRERWNQSDCGVLARKVGARDGLWGEGGNGAQRKGERFQEPAEEDQGQREAGLTDAVIPLYGF